MIHEIKVKEQYYNKIKTKEKIYEVRLFDEKRQKIKIGDIIKINKEPQMVESLNAKVIDLLYFKNFEEMANNLPAKQIGFDGSNWEYIVNEYHKFYSEQEEQKYGVIAIKIEVQ